MAKPRAVTFARLHQAYTRFPAHGEVSRFIIPTNTTDRSIQDEFSAGIKLNVINTSI
jgi:hypothetical protein